MVQKVDNDGDKRISVKEALLAMKDNLDLIGEKSWITRFIILTLYAISKPVSLSGTA